MEKPDGWATFFLGRNKQMKLLKSNLFSTCLVITLLAAAIHLRAQTDNQSGNQPDKQKQNQSDSESDTNKPPRKVVVAQAASAEATIQDIDRKDRVVTLKGDDGNTVRIKIGEDAPNFDQLKKGDRVKADYYESTALSLQKAGEPIENAAGRQVITERGENGRGPTRLVVNTSTLTATVQDVDQKDRMVTLKGPDGKTVKLKADEHVRNFNDIKKGDQVVATFTDAMGISVVQEK
jgi:hypothetical protein